MTPLPRFWAVIPAGGSGTRLWPLSRAAEPKFLLDLAGTGSSLLQDTVARLTPLVESRLLVVTGARHAQAVRAQLPELPEEGLIAEPSARDSMAAIGLAAALLERRDPDSVLGSFAADHVIADLEGFGDAVRRAEAAAREGWLVTVGIAPTRPATGFGYLRLGDGLDNHPGLRRVGEFVEKPSAEAAAAYCASGDYLWNGGMFLVRPTVLLDLLATWHPEFAAALRGLAREPERLSAVWPTLPRIAVDHAVAEPAAAAGRVAVVPGDFGWDDLGDFASLSRQLGRTDAELSVLGDPDLVRSVDATGVVIPADRMVAVVGLENVVVVDTGDALLVTTVDHAQQVSAIVSALRDSGRADLT